MFLSIIIFYDDEILNNIEQFPQKKHFKEFDHNVSLAGDTSRFWIEAQKKINLDKQILDEIKHEFRITANIDYTTGSAILCNAKRFYAGCEATNFTGSGLNFNDIKIAACRLWYES